jgi:hypothetical protein
MTMNRTKATDVKRILSSALLTLTIVALPLSNALAQSTPASINAPTATAPKVNPNGGCTFVSPDFAGRVCATAEVAVFGPILIAGALAWIPIALVVWPATAIAVSPLVPKGGHNPAD